VSVKAIICGFVVGGMLATASVAVAAQTWSWYVDASGSASGSLGALQALDVSDAKGGSGLLPGDTFAVRVDIDNPNRVSLEVVSADVGDLQSGDSACDESLANSRLRFDRTPDITVKPGSNDGIVVGNVRLPSLLANACQGQDVSADVQLRAAFGASS
jgi:hypothetical protein